MLHSQVCCFAPGHCKRFSEYSLTGFIYLSVIQINCLCHCHNQNIYPAFESSYLSVFPCHQKHANLHKIAELTHCRCKSWERPRWNVVLGGCRNRCRWSAACWVVVWSPRCLARWLPVVPSRGCDVSSCFSPPPKAKNNNNKCLAMKMSRLSIPQDLSPSPLGVVIVLSWTQADRQTHPGLAHRRSDVMLRWGR